MTNTNRKKQREYRAIALQAARSQLRAIGCFPEETSFQDVLAVLDDMARSQPTLVASEWYSNASDAQIATLCRDWQKWLKEQQLYAYDPMSYGREVQH